MFICYITLFALKISLTTDLWVAENRSCFNEVFMWKHPKTFCENNMYRSLTIFFSSSWGFHFNFLRMLCQICVYFWSLLRYFKFPHSFIQNQLHFFFAQLKKIMNGWFGWLPFFNHNLLLFYVMLHFASCTISRQFVLKTCCSTKISWHNLQAINQRIVVALQDPRCC